MLQKFHLSSAIPLQESIESAMISLQISLTITHLQPTLSQGRIHVRFCTAARLVLEYNSTIPLNFDAKKDLESHVVATDNGNSKSYTTTETIYQVCQDIDSAKTVYTY